MQTSKQHATAIAQHAISSHTHHCHQIPDERHAPLRVNEVQLLHGLDRRCATHACVQLLTGCILHCEALEPKRKHPAQYQNCVYQVPQTCVQDIATNPEGWG